MRNAQAPATTGTEADERLELRPPQISGSLAVFPLSCGTPHARRYLAFTEAAAMGLSVNEVPGIPAVGALQVSNPLHFPVLVYGGEEVLGAQQNRVFATTMLVQAGATTRVPVRCVEAGRWDAGRHDEPLSPSPQAAAPSLRSLGHPRWRGGAPDENEAQYAVWEDLDEAVRRLSVESSSLAMHDVFETHRARLDELAAGIVRHDDQVGALVAIGGRFVVLDYVSDPAVWSALHDQLVQGYALDALDAPERAWPSEVDARDFLDLLWQVPRRRDSAAPGLGETAQFAFGGLAGSSLEWEEETAALTAFAASRLRPWPASASR